MAIDVKRIQKSIKKLRKLTSSLPKQSSPEQVHKLRTNSRKLEATFGSLSLDSGKNESQLMKQVRRIRRRAGKVRDLDVLTANLAGVQAEGETECEVKLLEYLGSERHKQAGKLHRLVRSEADELKLRLRKAARDLKKVLQKNSEPASLAAAHALQLSADLASPRRLNRGNLHSYRLKVKELRYVLQLSNSDHHDFVDDLGDVKDAIGDWHDWEQLIGRAHEVLDHGAGCRLLQKLKQISDARYEKAINLVGHLRRNYLRVTAPSKKKPQPVRLAPAAISATAALSENDRARAA